jgi:mannitol/fructose-specific phosphotransferase system IIA component (Ntr-type)
MVPHARHKATRSNHVSMFFLKGAQKLQIKKETMIIIIIIIIIQTI